MKMQVDNADDLIALFAHDLKGSFTGISGFADLLANSGPLNERQQRWLEKIDDSIQRGLQSIDHMVSLSKVAAQPLELGIHAIRPMIDDALGRNESQIVQRHLSVQVDIAPDASTMYCDPRWLPHVVYNLVTNAVKYNREQGSVTISTWTAVGADFLRVSDTGIGIPGHAVDHIFSKFYRVGGSSSEGSGLGLSVVKAIVDQHGGQIIVETTPHDGSSFTVRLPHPAATANLDSGEDLDAFDDDSQEGADLANYADRRER